MPLKWAQQHYWNVSSTVVPPATGPGQSGYPAWQASVVGMGLGGLEGAWGPLRAWWRRTSETVTLWRRLQRLPPEPRRVLACVLRAVEGPDYANAGAAVRETAVTLGFARSEAWMPYARMLKASPGRAENVFRHVRATELTRERLSSTRTNPELNLLVELAYCGFAVKGRYFDTP